MPASALSLRRRFSTTAQSTAHSRASTSSTRFPVSDRSASPSFATWSPRDGRGRRTRSPPRSASASPPRTPARFTAPALACVAVALVAAATLLGGERRVVALAAALALAGWWWGSVRLAALDRSVLAAEIGTAERARLEVTASPRRSRYHVRVPVVVLRFGARAVREPALLQLPPGRAPPQGSIVSAIVTVEQPRGPDHGFDERSGSGARASTSCCAQTRWRAAGRRGGLGGLADRLRARVERPIVARNVGRTARGSHRRRARRRPGRVGRPARPIPGVGSLPPPRRIRERT